MATLIDPLKFLKEDRASRGEQSSAEFLTKLPPVAAETTKQAAQSTTSLTQTVSLAERAKKDFRVFLTLIWRFLLKCDPNPIQLDMAWWLQHGPDRSIIMAFRGFSKSWITGAYALWRLYVNPNEQILVVSGSLTRAVATTNWCLQIIMTMPFLAHMIPKPSYRQSSMKFDVGSCENPGQSASFTAFGIGGQLVGFRGTCIIPDDVETQTNSLTVVMREKIWDGVKEFESVLSPADETGIKPVIKYLGTPHDLDSLYMKLLRLRDTAGKPIYAARVWPALFPTEEEIKGYGQYLAPYIVAHIRKHGPSAVGHSTMPMRFTDADLATRKAAIGASEFKLQFMLDLTGQSLDKFPLKLKDLIVMDLDMLKGPDEVVWGNLNSDKDLPVMGMNGDFYYPPVSIGASYTAWTNTIAYVDGSGRGKDETSMSTVSELFGRAFWRDLFASTDGYGHKTLQAIADRCVKFRVNTLYVESNYGDGMFTALLRPVLVKAWDKANREGRLSKGPTWVHGGTTIEEVKSGKAQKELRILSVLEPVTQQHRLVIDRRVIKQDAEDIARRQAEGEGNSEESGIHRYAWGYQYTHLTRERDCLGHDDRLESLSGAVSIFAPSFGVDPLDMAIKAQDEREQDWLEKMLDDEEDAVNARMGRRGPDLRVQAATPAKR